MVLWSFPQAAFRLLHVCGHAYAQVPMPKKLLALGVFIVALIIAAWLGSRLSGLRPASAGEVGAVEQAAPTPPPTTYPGRLPEAVPVPGHCQ